MNEIKEFKQFIDDEVFKYFNKNYTSEMTKVVIKAETKYNKLKKQNE